MLPNGLRSLVRPTLGTCHGPSKTILGAFIHSHMDASLYIVGHGCKGKTATFLQCSELILRLCDSAQRHASQTLRGALIHAKPETPWTLQTLRHTSSSTSEASTRPYRFLCPVGLVCCQSLLNEDLMSGDSISKGIRIYFCF